jgi:hypothetical protein
MTYCHSDMSRRKETLVSGFDALDSVCYHTELSEKFRCVCENTHKHESKSIASLRPIKTTLERQSYICLP